jgi:DNA-binding LytR/AlgR family response regulator
VLAATYLNFNRKNQLHLSEAQTLNNQLHEHPVAELPATVKLSFSSASQEPGWELTPDQFLFAETADNYLQLYTLTEEGIERRILRSTLRTVEDEAHYFPYLVRTHRSFLSTSTKSNPSPAMRRASNSNSRASTGKSPFHKKW